MDDIKEPKFIYSLGKNTIWCKNNCISGNKFYFIIFVFLSYTIPFITLLVIIFKIKDKSSSLSIFTIILLFILYFIEIFSTFRTGFTDPGILPKQYTIKAPKKKIERKSIIRGHLFNLKYCFNCDVFRPPRTSHCRKCDNCVQKFDHHSDWIGNCIGKRNYKYFIYYFFVL